LFPWQSPEWTLADRPLSGTAAVDAVAEWSAAAGIQADPVQLAAALAGKPEYFIEDLFFRLLTAAGLREAVDEVDDDSLHTLATGWRDPAKLRIAIAVMKPGMRRSLDCYEHEDCFARVSLRPDGVYELEYGDRSPEEHYLTATPSLDEVVEAMTEWSASEVGWRDGFSWTRVGTPPPESSGDGD
jgi:hypothetical protein